MYRSNLKTGAPSPIISVIVPVYRTKSFLRKCIESLLSQSFSDFELLIINDACPDKSLDIISDLSDSRIKYISHEKNLGLSGTRNTGLNHARGEFVCFVDSDDYVSERILELMYSMAKYHELDVVIAGCIYVDEDYRPLRGYRYAKKIIQKSKIPIDIFNLTHIAIWGKLWKRSLFKNNDILFPLGRIWEDIATTPRLLSVSRRIGMMEECLYFYFRSRPDSITNTISSKNIIDYFYALNIIKEHLIKNKQFFDQKDNFHQFIRLQSNFHRRNIQKILPLVHAENYSRILASSENWYLKNFDNDEIVKLDELAKYVTIAVQELKGIMKDA